MKSRYSKIFYVVGAVIVILLLGLLCVAFADIDEQFERQLLRIRSRGRKASTLKDYQELEAQSLKLVKDHNTPNEKGMIHAMIALAYSDKGFGLSNDVKEVQLSKTIEYGKKALVRPLPNVPISCRVHGKLADAMFIKAMRGPKDKYVEARREAIVPCLKGLKLALDNKAPKERPEPPPPMLVPHSITPNKGPKYQEEIAKYEKQLAEWKHFRHLCSLQRERYALTIRCLTMYSEEPYDTQELREYARKILVGYDEVVNELIVQVEKRISEKELRRAKLQDKSQK